MLSSLPGPDLLNLTCSCRVHSFDAATVLTGCVSLHLYH